MIYVVLIVIATGLSLLIQNGAYVTWMPRQGYGPGGYRPLTREQARNGAVEFTVYVLMAGVSACRIAVGNDYWVYRDNFKLIAQGRYVSSEPGFNLTVRGLVELFGYDHYLPVFGFFSLITVFFFVRALHDQGKYFAFSLFLLFTEGFYFNSLNTVRYYLALAVAMFAMKYVLQGRYLPFAALTVLGALFHKSILLVLPVYLLARCLARTKWRVWYAAVLGGFLASLCFGQRFYRFIIFKIYPFYENSQFDQSRISYKNLAVCLGTLLLGGVLWLSQRAAGGKEEIFGTRRGSTEEFRGEALAIRFYFILNLFGLIAVCCGSFVPEVTRVAYYMTVSQVFLVPLLIGKIPQRRLRVCCQAAAVLAFSGLFALSLRQMTLTDVRLLPYLNWIFN